MRTGSGVVGAGEPFDRRVPLRVSQPVSVMVERAVARTCFARPYLLREALLRGFDAAVVDLRASVRRARAAGAELQPLAEFYRLNRRRRRRTARNAFDPYDLLGDSPWTHLPQPLQLTLLLTASQRRLVDTAAVSLGLPFLVVVRHALALGWSSTVDEIVLLLADGYRPAYLFRCFTEKGRRSAGPWTGQRSQPLYGPVWLRRPGEDLSRVDPPLTEPDPRDPFLDEL